MTAPSQVNASLGETGCDCASSVQGLVALVVGGGSGIGEACAKAFAAAGGAAMIGDLRLEGASRVATEIETGGHQAAAVHLDVGVQADIDAAVNTTVVRFGRIDVVVNAAAMVRPAKLEDCSLEDWAACFRVNVVGALMLARTCLPYLRQSPAASIVNIGSLSGMFGRPNGGSYGPSKAALVSLTRQMALEWAPYGVRANIVNPGNIDTPLARAAVGQKVLDERAKVIPLARIGSPEEVADLVVFLASPAARYITAQAINCDGGFSETLMSAPMGTSKKEA
ncbi:MAG: SDR family NAD(P)-dependent oxidoreductase [Hyphomicrobiaceae bacterium]